MTPPHSSGAPGLPGWEQDPVSPGLNSDAGSWRRRLATSNLPQIWPKPRALGHGAASGHGHRARRALHSSHKTPSQDLSPFCYPPLPPRGFTLSFLPL